MSEQTLPPINANKPQPVKRGAQAAVNGRRYEILIAKKCSAYKSPPLVGGVVLKLAHGATGPLRH